MLVPLPWREGVDCISCVALPGTLHRGQGAHGPLTEEEEGSFRCQFTESEFWSRLRLRLAAVGPPFLGVLRGENVPSVPLICK